MIPALLIPLYAVPGVRQVDVRMTFEPQWGMEMMSDEARLELGFM